MRDTEMETCGIKTGGRKVSNLRYADATGICANNITEATAVINKLNETGEKKSLKLNAKKTKYMFIGKGTPYPLDITGEKIESVDHFSYV